MRAAYHKKKRWIWKSDPSKPENIKLVIDYIKNLAWHRMSEGFVYLNNGKPPYVFVKLFTIHNYT